MRKQTLFLKWWTQHVLVFFFKGTLPRVLPSVLIKFTSCQQKREFAVCTVQSEVPPCVHLLPAVSLPQHSGLFCCLFFLSPPLCWSIRRCFMKAQQAITFPSWLISNSLALTLQIYLTSCFVPGTQVNAHASHTVYTLNTFPLLRIFDILPPDLHIRLFSREMCFWWW